MLKHTLFARTNATRLTFVLSVVVAIACACGIREELRAASNVEREQDVLRLNDDVRTKCLTVLRDGLRSEEFWPSIHAAEALTLTGHGNEVRKFLEPKLVTETDDQKRCGLARELIRAGDRRHASLMLDILAGGDPYGHVHAAESLYKVFEIGDGRAMRRAFAQSEHVTLQLMAAAALGRSGNPAAMSLLRERLTDDAAEVSRIAAWILGRIGDTSDLPQLQNNVKRAKDPLTRSYNEHALAALGDEDGLKALERNLSDDDPSIRTYAATFAGDARALFVADKLRELLNDENLDVRVRAAQSLLVLAQPAAPDNDEDISQLVYEATKENPRYTEGSIVELNDGSLLFAVTQFASSGSDFARAQIVARRSHDGGRSWGPQRVLQESSGKMNVMSVSLLRLHPPHDDTIAMFYLEKNDFDDLRVYVRFSRDEAQSFSAPIRVTAEPGYHVMNNDRVRKLSSGRLLAPVATTEDVRKVNHFVSLCWLSDDGGETWRKGKGHVDLPQRGAMEPEVIELADGRVLMIMRTQLGYIATSYSDDGGETWSEPGTLTLKAPEAPATLRRIPATGDLLLVWNDTFTPGAGHGGKRTPLTVAISTDEGKTWANVRNLESNSDRTYSYTSLMFTRGRAVMSYWESNPDGRLSTRFRSLPVSRFYSESR